MNFSLEEDTVFTEQNLALMGFNAPIFQQFIGHAPKDLEWNVKNICELACSNDFKDRFKDDLVDFFHATFNSEFTIDSFLNEQVEKIYTCFFPRYALNNCSLYADKLVLQELEVVKDSSGRVISKTKIHYDGKKKNYYRRSIFEYDDLGRLQAEYVMFSGMCSGLVYKYKYVDDCKYHCGKEIYKIFRPNGADRPSEYLLSRVTVLYNGEKSTDNLENVTKVITSEEFSTKDIDPYTVIIEWQYNHEEKPLSYKFTHGLSGDTYTSYINDDLGALMTENIYSGGSEYETVIRHKGKILVRVK